MKFRILLWLIGRMLGKSAKTSQAMQDALKDKNLAFTLQTRDGRIARSFRVADQRISSQSGAVAEPAFVMNFRDAAYAFAVLTAKKKQQAFMQGIQDKEIVIEGNVAEVIWFQSILKHLGRKR